MDCQQVDTLIGMAGVCFIFTVTLGIFSAIVIGIIAYVRGQLSWRSREDV